MKVVTDLRGAFVEWAVVAPCITGAVVGADARGVWRCGDELLDEDPLDGEAASSIFDDDCWRAGAGAVEMETAAADVDELAGWAWGLREGGESCQQEEDAEISTGRWMEFTMFLRLRPRMTTIPKTGITQK